MRTARMSLSEQRRGWLYPCPTWRAAFAAAIVFLVFGWAEAGTINYWVHDPSEAGSWHEPTNWHRGYVPYAPESYPVIKNGGTAVLSQPGQTCVSLTVGDDGDGTLQMTGGSLTTTFGTALADGTCTGVMVQSGGTHVAHVSLNIGYYGAGVGEYYLSGDAVLQADGTVVGGGGQSGLLEHSGSAQHTTNTDLFIGNWNGTEGTYTLHSGTLTVNRNEYVGQNGKGTLTQWGGTHTIVSEFRLGRNATGDGTVNLHGGSLTAPSTEVGRSGKGTFHYYGGTFSPGPLSVAKLQGSTGEFHLYDPAVLNAPSVAVGYWGNGLFVQHGGTHTVGTDLRLGNSFSPAARYEMHAGSLSVGQDLVLGDGSIYAAAEFDQTGGDVSAQTLYVGNTSGGSYSMSGGSLTVANLTVRGGSTLALTDAAVDVTVSEMLTFYNGGVFEAVPGVTMHLTGTQVLNYCTNPDDLLGLNSTRFIFEGGDGDTDDFEVAGLDVGADPGGLDGNFALHALVIGGADVGHVRLVDNYDNGGDGAGNETLYVRLLTVGDGASLDLNGRTLYCGVANIAPTATIEENGGSIIPGVPEPATLALLAIGGAGLLVRRRRPSSGPAPSTASGAPSSGPTGPSPARSRPIATATTSSWTTPPAPGRSPSPASSGPARSSSRAPPPTSSSAAPAPSPGPPT
ncbi:MAG TPA: PEP-CTERM sorting domain-containing protein [Phycisphaerae bacterium]|nr:PEP-CTERM sorting domain-containing protein [Phycisphaerae bacterium]